MDLLWKNSKSPSAKLRAVAFQHSRLVAIHGFKDGNGRVSRLAMDYALYRTGLKSATFDISRADYINGVNSAIKNNNIGRLSRVLARKYALKYAGSDFHSSPFKVAAFQDTNKLSFENSKLSSIEFINNPGTTKDYHLKPGDIERLIERVGGKPGQGFKDSLRKLLDQISRPLSIGESLDAIKTFRYSEPLKKAFFKAFDENAYVDFARQHFDFAARFSSQDEKIQFGEMLSEVMGGRSPASVVDVFVEKLSSNIHAERFLPVFRSRQKRGVSRPKQSSLMPDKFYLNFSQGKGKGPFVKSETGDVSRESEKSQNKVKNLGYGR